jgi:hypothetical protein
VFQLNIVDYFVGLAVYVATPWFMLAL